MAKEPDFSYTPEPDFSYSPEIAKDTPKPTGALRKLGDLGLGFASGAIGATKAIADAAGAGNKASSVLSSLNTGINDYLSPEAKADQQEQSQLLADASGKGVWEGVKAGAKAFGVAPVQTAVQGLGSIVPIIAGTALTGGVAPAAAVGAGIGAAMGAGTAKGAIYDEIKKRGGTEEEAVRAQEYGGANTDQIALGGVLGTADALTGVSRMAGNAVRGAIGKPVAQNVSNAVEQGIIRRSAMGMLSEMPLEAVQGGQEQVAANLAAQRAGYEAGTWDNVASNATLEALASAGPGAAFGAFETSGKPIAPQPAPTNPAPNLFLDPGQLAAVQSEELGEPEVTQTTPPDGRAILAAQREVERNANRAVASPDDEIFDSIGAVDFIRPSQKAGLDAVNGGVMERVAAKAMDSGLTQSIEHDQGTAQDQAAYEQAMQEKDQQAAQMDSADKPITSGPIAEAQMSEEDKRAILFSNQAVADGGRKFEGTQDGDVLNGMGAPFATRLAAARRANMEGKDWTIAPVFDGWVARRKDAFKDQDGATTGVSPADTASSGPDGNNAGTGVGTGTDGRNGLGADTGGINTGRVDMPGEQAVGNDAGAVADAPKVVNNWTNTGELPDVSQDVKDPAPAAVASDAAPAAELPGAGSAQVEPAGVGPASLGSAKADMDHLFGVDAKRKTALDRIAAGKAWFGNALKAGEFIAKSGLKDTHESVKTGATRWDIRAKAQATSQPTESTNVPQANQAQPQQTQQQEAPAAAKPVESQAQQDWTRTRDVDRMALLLKAGLPQVSADRLKFKSWNNLAPRVQEKLTKAMSYVGEVAPSAEIDPDIDELAPQWAGQYDVVRKGAVPKGYREIGKNPEGHTVYEAGGMRVVQHGEYSVSELAHKPKDGRVAEFRTTEEIAAKQPAKPTKAPKKQALGPRVYNPDGSYYNAPVSNMQTADAPAKPELATLTKAMNDLMEVRQRIVDQGQVVDDRLLSRERQLQALVKELERDGQNDELDAEMQSYEAKPNPTYSGETKTELKAPETQSERAQAATKKIAESDAKAALSEREKAAKAKMFNALGKLAALAGKNTRMNWTQEEEQQLLPIVIELFDGAMELGAVSFQQAVAYVRDFIGSNLDQETADAIPFDTLQGAYISVAGRHKDKAVTSKKVVASFESLEELNLAAPDAVNLDSLEITAEKLEKTGESLAESLTAAILSNNMPKDNPALKKLVEAFDGKPADPARMKEAQEALEAALVNVSRGVVAKNEGTRTTFDVLLRLYQSQPNLNIRTSTSIANMAYSTPAPLAYLGSVLADVTPKTSMYEPTGGNGMLTINALPGNVTINELEANRIESLKSQGFKQVLEGDALKADVAPKSQDRLMTNPPFGSVKDAKGEATKVSVDGYKIGQIDHLIAARALETMKDDGKATLIIGANKVSGGLNTDDRIFFNWLYGNYNVTSHFEVDGDLYARQGAGWPVRVITVHGRQKSDRVSPVAGTIQRAQNWEQVYEHFTASLDSSRTESQQGASTSSGGTNAGQAGLQPIQKPVGKSDSKYGGRGQAGSQTADAGLLSTNSDGSANGGLGGESGGVQRLNGDDIESDRLDPAGDAVITAPAKSLGNPGETALTSADNQFQVTYEPRSSRKDGGVLIPVNMKDPTQDALSRLEDAVGNIDDYAAKELGYKSVEKLHEALMGLQVDSVASAIYQINQGKGVVIADQTGIGKGRQAAAIIRWAKKEGHIPVFVSVTESLYTDMFGDLHDIGSDDITPFILNKDAWIKGPNGEKLFKNKAIGHRQTMERIRDSGKLPDGSNAIFMTYHQVNTGNVQRQMLTALADRAVFILDESHNAGGQSNTGEFITSLLEGAKGVTYLSATYAKRPDNMPLYFKTDIGQAAADNEGLMQAMANGGLPLQTVVSNNLVKAGQMFRRERSYDGVSIETISDTDHREEHEALSDETTKALRAIVDADRMFHHVFVKQMSKDMQKLGGAVIDNAGNQAQAGVDHTQFSSVVHSFIKQMLLGLKAQRAADDAIAALKRNEKPIIAVENTMGSFLEAYAKDNAVAQGGGLGSFDYRTVLSRALARTLFINEVKPNGEKVKREIKLGQLDPETRAAYDAAQAVINGLKLDIPVSPIDWIRNEIRKAGFTIAEITGRKLAVDYSTPGKAFLGAIDALEQSDKVRTTQLFNSGRLDALILNVAGSTGISLHASEKFEDQRQRHMIVAQAAGDINIFMQMLGRIHRTGQVVLPKYSILSVDLPTEKRPTAVLSGKMKSLNANTSSNTDSATSIKTVDMFNKYGDQVVGQYLQDNYALARALDVEDLIGGEGAAEDLARKATGRLALQPIAVQNAFYEEVEAQYSAMMEYLNKTNQNDLEPRTFDYDAQETRQEVLFDGPNKESPFGEDAIYGEYSIKAQGKAMTPAEIREAMNGNLEGETPDLHMRATLAPLVKQFDDYIATLEGPARDSANATRAAGQAFMVNHSIGDTFRVDINGDSFNAVVTNIRNTHKANGNPFSLSKIQVTIALNGALRSISVPASQFQKIEVSQIGRGYSVEQLFKEQPANQRETAKIVTGNLLAAYGELQGVRGTIITFTKQDGTTEQGILLPKAFDFKNNTRADYRLATAQDALTFLQKSENKDIGRFGIQSRDGVVRVLPAGRGIAVLVPKSKLKGGKYFLDAGLIEVMGDFVTSGSAMKATTYDSADAVKVLDLLMKKNALYAIPSMAEEAKALSGPTDAPAAFSRPTFSRGAQSQANESVERLARSIASHWENAPKLVIAFDMNDPLIPEVVRKADQRQRSGGATGTPEGFYYKGTTYLMSSRLSTPNDIARVMFHESLGHHGLRGLFGKALKPILRDIAVLRKSDVDAKIKQYGLKGINQLDRMEAAEEVLAELAQTKPEISFVQRAMAAIRTWLREHVPGFNSLRLTNAELIRNYILPARNFVENGGGPRGGLPVRVEPALIRSGASPYKNEPAKVEQIGDKWAVVRKLINGGSAHEYYSSADEANSAIERYEAKQRLDADTRAGKFAQWSVLENSSQSFRDDGFGRNNAVDAGNKIRQTLNARIRAIKSVGEADGLQQIPSRAGFCFKCATDASYAGLGDYVIGASPSDNGPIWHAVVMRGGMVYDPTFGKWFAPGVYEQLGFKEAYRLSPEQVRSFVKESDGKSVDAQNQGLGDNPDIRFSRSIGEAVANAANNVHDVNLPAGYTVGDLLKSAPGKLNWWHRSVGTMYNLAERSPLFKRVYDSVQNFINDVSYYATEAADLAPNFLPKLETWKDIGKSPLSAEDTKAISAPIFEGTLIWARDESGKPIKLEALEAQAASLSPEQKAQRLLRNDMVSEQVLKMWQGLPIEQFESIINGKYERDMLKAGVVWTDAELKSMFSLTDTQIPLYREFRKATDKSLSNLAISDMLRFGGKDTAPVREAALEAESAMDAGVMLRDYLLSVADMDPERSAVLIDTANKMIEKADKAKDLIARGYAPLSRYGQYTLDVVSADGERVYFGMFESKMDAARMARRMEQEYPGATMTRGTVSEEEYKLFAGVSPETLELFGDMLGLEAQGDDAASKAFQTYLKLAKSSRSSMKRMIQRKGIAGFSEDSARVLAGFVYSNARQTASNLHMGEMTEAANEVSKTQGELKDQAVRLVDYVKNPREEAQAFRGLLFAQYIGGSVASAMVNMTQPITMTFPWLSQYAGAAGAAKQMTAAMKDANKKLTGDARLDAALKRAEEDGTVSPQEVHQLLQQSQGRGALQSGDGTKAGDAMAAANNALSRFSLGWGKLFSLAEQFNRRVTFIAAYRAAVDKGMPDPDGFARKAIAETQGVYNKGNKPAWARGAVGSVLFTFKQYSIAYVEMLHRMATQGGPEGKKAAMLALGVLFLMSGAGGIPGGDDLDDLISGIMQRLGYNFDSKTKRKEFFASLVGEGGAQFLEHGVSGLPGMPIDVSGRLGMGNLIPGTGLLVKKVDHTRDLAEIAGPAGDFAKRGFDAAGKVLDGNIMGAQGAVATVVPKAAQNLFQAYDMANMGMYRDAKGMKVLDTDGMDAAMKAIGFQPNDVKKVQDASFESQRMIGLNRLRETEIANRWALGIFEKDTDKVQAAREELREWNETNPDSPIRINFKQILQRVQKMNQTKAERITAAAPKEIRADVKRALATQ